MKKEKKKKGEKKEEKKKKKKKKKKKTKITTTKTGCCLFSLELRRLLLAPLLKRTVGIRTDLTHGNPCIANERAYAFTWRHLYTGMEEVIKCVGLD